MPCLNTGVVLWWPQFYRWDTLLDAGVLLLYHCRISRIPLHKMRTVRRMLSENGRTIDEIKSMAREKTSKVQFSLLSTTTPSPSPTKLPPPIEKLTNFMDVRESGISHWLCILALAYNKSDCPFSHFRLSILEWSVLAPLLRTSLCCLTPDHPTSGFHLSIAPTWTLHAVRDVLGHCFDMYCLFFTKCLTLAVSQGCTIATTLRSQARMFRMARRSRSSTAEGVSLASSVRTQSLWVKTTGTDRESWNSSKIIRKAP